MAQASTPVRSVAWQEVFPWLILLRVAGVALSARSLLLATTALLLSSAGWWLVGFWTTKADGQDQSAQTARSERTDGLGAPRRADSAMHEAPTARIERTDRSGSMDRTISSVQAYGTSRGSREYSPPRTLVEVFSSAYAAARDWSEPLLYGWGYLLNPPTWREIGGFIIPGIWTALVWMVFGGALLRIAAARLGRETWIGPIEAIRHVLRRPLSYLGAPLLPLVAILLGASVLWLLGVIMAYNVGFVVAALVWPLVLLATFMGVLLLVGLVFGWPLMWAALGIEPDCDAWDAISRAYAAVLQKPLRYTFYVAVALIPGWLGWVLVYHISELILFAISSWITHGADAVVADSWIVANREAIFGNGEANRLGFGWFVWACNQLVRAVAGGYGYGYFFCASAGIYLLLRQDTTQIPLDEIALGEESDSLQLPPLPPAPDMSSESTPGTGAASSQGTH
jgi:hypothetical protein